MQEELDDEGFDMKKRKEEKYYSDDDF